MTVEIRGEAVQQLKEYRAKRGLNGCIRIGIMSGGGSGAILGIMVDDPRETDEIFAFDDLQVVVDRALLTYCHVLTVDYVQKGGGCGSGGGFLITPKNAL